MSLTIIKNGIADTIQDAGRYGYADFGINPGGSTDKFAANIANYLVGNEDKSPVIEIHFPGPQLLFEQNALISITGADMQPTLDGESIDCWRPIVVRKNSLLQFSKLAAGAWSYLAVHGGFAADEWLGSYSTHLKAGMGGWKGRQLQKGDEIPFAEIVLYYASLLRENEAWHSLPWKADMGETYQNQHEIFVLKGSEWDELDFTSQLNFIEKTFTILPSSDRMGYQLKGESLSRKQPTELISAAVDFGTVQLLPGGQLIVLMSDHQTTGGYPKLANVITAHLPKLAQLKTGGAIRFRLVDSDTAEELLFSQQKHLQILQQGCYDQLNKYLCKVLT